MKAIKLSGLTSRASSLLRRSRINELDAATRFRTLSSISVAIGVYNLVKSSFLRPGAIIYLTILVQRKCAAAHSSRPDVRDIHRCLFQDTLCT